MGIEKTLQLHKLWVLTDGQQGEPANLFGANLSETDLSGANLNRANLNRANLSRANLNGANLNGADLFEANLFGANLSGANLFEATLLGANLFGAKGILQWQSPMGHKRICYSVKHETCIMQKLGCFWGTTEEAVTAIREKYGENSLYERYVVLAAQALEMEAQ